ncbi:MAG TPA: helix-hairpin-helix domain-containing protein [Thermoanaerobaculia bacterium]|nr:helix-hairpin-helix domain-containing protein [Thermoanaerobaculia bacterium]
MKRFTQRLTALAAALALALVALPALAADAAPKGVVNVNSASAAELERLPGVGPSLAARIVEHREQHGAFKAKEDLMLVRGIGEKSYERLAPYVAISGATTLAERVPGERPARKADAADRD